MIAEYKLNTFKWIDVQNPTKEELQILRREYDIDFKILSDLSEPLSDTRILCAGDQTYFAFHVVSTLSLEKQPQWHELDMIIAGNVLLTVTYDIVPAIDSLRRELEIEASLKKSVTITLDQFVSGIIHKIHLDLRMLITAINAHQLKIDNQIFGGSERLMVRAISNVGRILFRLNQTLAEQRHVIKFFPEPSSKKDEFKFLDFWTRELEHTADQTAAQYQLYHDLRKTNEELLATKQNEVMRKLTMVAFITSPLTILAGIFGMNARYMPIIGNGNDFWVIVMIMAVIVLAIVSGLKFRGWFQ